MFTAYLCQIFCQRRGHRSAAVDAEGYDTEVIRMFDFDRYRPAIVRFETFGLSRCDHDRAVARLVKYGYKLAVTGMDTVGWHDR